jgi:dTMP kinase
MNAFASGELETNLTFVLDVPPEIGLQRRRQQRGEQPTMEGPIGRADDRIEQRGVEFQARVRAAFLEIAASEPHRVVVLNATSPAKVVHERVYRALRQKGLLPRSGDDQSVRPMLRLLRGTSGNGKSS